MNLGARRFLWLATSIVLLTGVLLAAPGFMAPGRAQSAKTQLTDPVLAERFNAVSDRLVCQCGCQMIVRVCNMQDCGSAIPIRREIERQLLAGRTDDEIVQSFVDEHGLKILSSPPPEGINLAAYVMPGFAILVGLFLVIYVTRRWTAGRRLTAATPEAPVVVDVAVRQRIENDLKNRSE